MLSQVVDVAEEYKRAKRGILTNSTINRRLAVLRRVANLSYRRWGWLNEPLGEKIEMLPENPPREVFMSRGQLASALWSIKNRDQRRAALVSAFTGLRRGELMKLTQASVNRTDWLIRLEDTKNGKTRIVPVVHHVRFAVRRLPFALHVDSLSHAMPEGFRFHDLRRTTGSLLIQAGVPLPVISKILGHSSITITMKVYAHLLVDNLIEGMNALSRCTKPAPKDIKKVA